MLLCWCFADLRHFSGHFGRGLLTYPHCSWASLLGRLPVLSAHSFASSRQLPFLNKQKWEERKRIKKIHASYTLEGTNLEKFESIKYLGVTITSDLRWNTHVSNVCTKANRTLGFLRRNLYSCPQEVKQAAYKGLVRPVLDYGSSVWDPPGVVLQEELESVQKRAARFVTGNYNYETGSMTGILWQFKWESLKKRRKDNRLILLYKGLKGKASVPTDDLIPKTRRCRNQHSMAFQTPIANTDVYKGSFFPQTIRDWNALPDTLISSAEDAEDSVAKFTSLVRARD